MPAHRDIKSEIDFQAIAEAAASRLPSLLRAMFPEGKCGTYEFTVGDIDGNPGDSLSINLKTSAWADFATGEKGGDFTSLWAAKYHVSQVEAAQAVAAEVGHPIPDKPRTNGHGGAHKISERGAKPEWQPIHPVPADAHEPDFTHYKHGSPASVWDYRDAEDRLLGHTRRFDHGGGRKDIIPLSYCKHPETGELAWQNKAFKRPRPLYGLDLLARRASAPVLLVEGEKTADAAEDPFPDYVTVTWPGGTGAEKYADWSALQGRDVVLWPDHDLKREKSGELKPLHEQPGLKAALKIAEKINAICQSVRIVDTYSADTSREWKDGWDLADPPPPAGIDVRTLVDEAKAPEIPKSEAKIADSLQGEGEQTTSSQLLPPPHDPMAVARKLIAARYDHSERPLVICQGGQFYVWDGTCWPAVDDRDIRTACYEFTETASYLDGKKVKDWAPRRKTIGDLMDALGAVAHIDGNTPQPSWLAESDLSAGEMVACRNGLVHIPSRTLHRHTPAYYVHHSVPFDFDPDARSPDKWRQFLADLWEEDVDAIDTLQEMFGYLLAGDTRQQKMFLLIGPRRSGKGTIMRVLTALVGAHNVAGPTLAGLGTNFGLSPLIGKPVAAIADARLGNTNTSVVAERLLSISGEDTLTVDRKYRDPLSLQFPTRIVILSNELPRLADASGALASRFIVLTLTQSFYGRENVNLTRELLEELPGIFNWALDGFERLQKRGRFIQPASSEDMIREMEDLGSPISAFVRDRCEVGGEYQVACNIIYDEWKDWCAENGRKPTSVQVFGRDLRAAFPGIKVAQPRNDEGRQFRVYNGIRRKP